MIGRHKIFLVCGYVTTLALGSWPRQGLARLRAKRKPRNEGKCEGMNPHTPKKASTFGVGIPVDSWIFRRWLQGSKPNGLNSSLYHWKDIETQMSKMGLHDSFEHLKCKLWPKERPWVKLAVWLPTTKSRESTGLPCV
jgi:hypothetical protein